MLYGPPTGRKERVKFPEAPAVAALLIPVGVCTAKIVAPDTFTLPLKDEVVSTSDNKGAEENKTVNKEEITKSFFKFIRSIQ